MKYTKKELEEAADFCGAMVSWWLAPFNYLTQTHPTSLWRDDEASRVAKLATRARTAVETAFFPGLCPPSWRAWAEAETLLRTGWQPGDPVEVLPW